jgi:hypothetical protein
MNLSKTNPADFSLENKLTVRKTVEKNRRGKFSCLLVITLSWMLVECYTHNWEICIEETTSGPNLVRVTNMVRSILSFFAVCHNGKALHDVFRKV